MKPLVEATLMWDNFEELFTVFLYNFKKLWIHNIVTIAEYVLDLQILFCFHREVEIRFLDCKIINWINYNWYLHDIYLLKCV